MCALLPLVELCHQRVYRRPQEGLLHAIGALLPDMGCGIFDRAGRGKAKGFLKVLCTDLYGLCGSCLKGNLCRSGYGLRRYDGLRRRDLDQGPDLCRAGAQQGQNGLRVPLLSAETVLPLKTMIPGEGRVQLLFREQYRVAMCNTIGRCCNPSDVEALFYHEMDANEAEAVSTGIHAKARGVFWARRLIREQMRGDNRSNEIADTLC